MSDITRNLESRIMLNAFDESDYDEIINRVQNELSSLVERDAYYETVFASDVYSYDVKLRASMYMSESSQSRAWGFEYLKGEALFVMVQEHFIYYIDFITKKDIQSLVSNPDFINSIASYYDVPFFIFSGYRSTDIEMSFKQALIKELVESRTMTFDLAAFIIRTNSHEPYRGVVQMDKVDDSLVLTWARETYSMDESLPDSWVRKSLSEII